jgi:hypothetical protein
VQDKLDENEKMMTKDSKEREKETDQSKKELVLLKEGLN